jgi:hypothetical protein
MCDDSLKNYCNSLLTMPTPSISHHSQKGFKLSENLGLSENRRPGGTNRKLFPRNLLWHLDNLSPDVSDFFFIEYVFKPILAKFDLSIAFYFSFSKSNGYLKLRGRSGKELGQKTILLDWDRWTPSTWRALCSPHLSDYALNQWGEQAFLSTCCRCKRKESPVYKSNFCWHCQTLKYRWSKGVDFRCCQGSWQFRTAILAPAMKQRTMLGWDAWICLYIFPRTNASHHNMFMFESPGHLKVKNWPSSGIQLDSKSENTKSWLKHHNFKKYNSGWRDK